MLFHDAIELGPEGMPYPPGTLILWDKQAAHYYGNSRLPWSHSWIHCDGLLVKRNLREAGVPKNSALKANDPSRLEKPLLSLFEELAGVIKPDSVIVRSHLIILIREAARSHLPTQRQPLHPGLTAARELLDTRYSEKLDLSALAKMAGWSVSHFCAEFRRAYGVPPMAYLTEKRMAIAASLLSGTSLPVGEVGHLVGYTDPYHFSKHFKNIHGVSPSSLRRQEA